MKMFRLLLLTLAALPSAVWAQYVATPQAGVSYPALTNPTAIVLTAPASNPPLDRGRATIPLGFSFPFYNRVYTQVTVTANGVLFFEPSSAANSSSDFSANVALPSGGEPNGVLAPLWDDLYGSNPTSALQSQALSGVNGAGLAIEYKDWNRALGSFSLTFQVRLWANGIVEFFYGPLTGSGGAAITATVGIESPSGTAGVSALTCGNLCGPTNFDPGGTGTPLTYFRFGPPPGVDLQPLSLRVDGMRLDGGELEIDTTFSVRNFGTLPSGAFGYGLYLSEDTIYDVTDLPLAPQPPGPFALGALQSTTHAHSGVVARPDGGSWYVLAAIPPLPDGGETNTFNNTLASTVPYAGGVDLVAESVSPPPIAGPGDLVSVPVAFSNQGFESAGSVGVKLYASLDPVLSDDDRLLTAQQLSVQGGQQVSQPVSFTLSPSTRANDYFVVLQLDDGPDAGAISERTEANNVVSSATRMQVRQADLTVTAVRVLRATAPYDETANVFLGEPVRLEAFVANIGGARAPDVRVSFFLSDNESLNAVTDVLVGSVPGLSFAPGESRWVPLTANVPTRGATGQPLSVQPYFFFGSASGVGLLEENPTNNFLASRPVVGRLPAPNLVPVELQTPLKAGAGELVALSRTLANFGNRDAPATRYRYYLSANPIITPDDAPLMRVTPTGDELDGTVTLAIGQRDSAVELVRLPATLSPAPFYLGVLADPEGLVAEADELDNGLAGRQTEIVPQALGLANGLLPDATVGLPYAVQLAGQGGGAPYTFALADARSLPAGLALAPSGAISGTPTQAGLSTVLLEVRSGGKAVVVSRPLRVSRATASLALRDLALPAPIRFVEYRAQLGAVGGAGPFAFRLVDGFLPVGLALTDAGELTGVPTDALGTVREFTVRVTDAIGNTDEGRFVMTVVDATPFVIQTRQLPDGQLGGPYVQSLFAVTSSRPVTWTLVDGLLPPGLAFEPTTSDTLVISGTPTRPGSFRFTVEAVDGQRRADAVTYFVFIASGGITPSVEGPRQVNPGAAVTISFSATPLPDGARWFWREGRLPPGLELSADGVVSGTLPGDAPEGVYSFTLGVGLAPDQLLSMASWSLEVTTEKLSRAGCAAVGADALVGLAALLLVSRRRRGARRR